MGADSRKTCVGEGSGVSYALKSTKERSMLDFKRGDSRRDQPYTSRGHRPEDRHKVPPHDQFVSKGREGGLRLPDWTSEGWERTRDPRR